MASRSEFSAQTLSVLAALCQEPSQWQHGYALAKQTGLKSGTLYPILIRLADRDLVEACWQDEPAGPAAAPVPADRSRAGQRDGGAGQRGRTGGPTCGGAGGRPVAHREARPASGLALRAAR